jgi:hypothetical protein
LTFAADIFDTTLFIRTPFQATFGIFDTDLKGTWRNTIRRGTFSLTFFAGRGRTIENTLLVFTTLVAVTEKNSFALTPGVIGLTGLRSLLAGSRAIRKTNSTGIGFTGFTAIDNTNGFVGVSGLAMFVIQTFDTATSTIAVLPLRTVFIRTTNTFVVLCTLFGRAGFSLTMNVLQTSDTLSRRAFFQNQASLWTFLTTGKNDGAISTTGELKKKKIKENNTIEWDSERRFHCTIPSRVLGL